jgi:RND family efflux transporter MFP subunit
MKPIKVIAFIVLLAAVAGGAFLAGKQFAGTGGAAAEKTLYTCGMHPQVIQDHPGNCPICGMKLTPLRRNGEGGAAASESAISIDPVTIQNMGLRTAIVTNGPLRRVIRTVATVDYDETALADVTTKFKGWVEKLYVDAAGAQVHRGDPLFEVYSPELYSAQTEYLLALQAAAGAGGEVLGQTAREKLKFFDISDAQIDELEKTRVAQKTLRVVAPMDGFVTEKMVVEGQMVDAGMKLYRLANLGIVWVQAQIYEQDLPFIRLGQEATVTLSYLPDRKFRGRVTYIYPTLDPMTRTARVRMEFHNPGYFLKPGMFASAELVSELEASALLVPDMAVLRSGQRNTVFVALEGGKFEPRTVTLGVRGENDLLQVLGGLRAGERIVTSGQFLLDSESQLREAIQKMTEPGKEQMTGSMPASSNGPVAVAPASSEGPVVYVCPMPEHVAIEYAHAGKCPICGMTLVPVTQSLLEKINPGGKVLYFTCPMPEHSSVHESKPGKCPMCGMTLIPVMEKPALPVTPQTAAQDETPLPTLYTCPMAEDADVVSEQPGICPKCEMKLVPTTEVKHRRLAEQNWLKQQTKAHQH